MTARNIAIAFLILTAGIIGYFVVSLWLDGLRIWGHSDIALDKTGQVGDFIGGVVGTIINAAAFYFLYLTLRDQRLASVEQREAFEKERLESKFFELIKMHRENVAEMEFQRTALIEENNIYSFESEIVNHKKVFRAIFKEFVYCVNELKPFITKVDRIYLPEYKAKLEGNVMIKNNTIDLVLLAKIDICYSIVFYGVGSEGLMLLNKLLRNKYKDVFVDRILSYISLKPKTHPEILKKWIKLSKRSSRPNKKLLLTEIYKWRETKRLPASLQELDAENAIEEIVQGYHNRFTKFYGGHQFRLGHYFRHLFQTVKYINEQRGLNYKDKYDYIKMLRAQLSTYEQAILFLNSLSSMGHAWELNPEVKDSTWGRVNFELITKYNLIKNLPGEALYGIPFKIIYPNIEYEGDAKKRDNSLYR